MANKLVLRKKTEMQQCTTRCHWIYFNERVRDVCHLKPRKLTRSSEIPLLIIPLAVSPGQFAKRAFRCSAPSVRNSLPSLIANSDSLTTFKSRLKTTFFRFAFVVHVCSQTPSDSAFKVTTLWRFIKQFIRNYCLLLLLLYCISRCL